MADPILPPVPAEALQDALDAFFEKLDGDEPLAAGDCWGAAELTAAFKVAAPILLTAGRTAAAADALRKISFEVVGLSDPADVHDDERLPFGAIRRALTEGTAR